MNDVFRWIGRCWEECSLRWFRWLRPFQWSQPQRFADHLQLLADIEANLVAAHLVVAILQARKPRLGNAELQGQLDARAAAEPREVLAVGRAMGNAETGVTFDRGLRADA